MENLLHSGMARDSSIKYKLDFNMCSAEDCPGYDSLDQRPGLLSSASKYRLSISSVAPIVVALDLNYI